MDAELKRFFDNFEIIANAPNGVKKLREMILQLAVRGRLVEQDEDDGSATELLNELGSAKAKMSRSGKNLKPINECDTPFNLPSNWVWARMEDVLDVRDGTHDTPKYQPRGIPLVTSKNLYSGKLDLTDVKFISETDHLKISERSEVEFNDILFAMIGSIGNPVIVDTQVQFSIKNVALFKYYVRTKPLSRFVLLFLQYAAEIMKSKATGAVQSFVSLGYLRSYLFPLPPLAEQHRIVAAVNHLMSLCDELEARKQKAASARTQLNSVALEKLLASKNQDEFAQNWHRIAQNFDLLYDNPENVAKLKQAILQLGVMGKLVEQDEADEPAEVILKNIAKLKTRTKKTVEECSSRDSAFPIPKGWIWCKLDDICLQITDGTHYTPKYQTEGVPFLSVKDITGGIVDFSRTRYIAPSEHAILTKRCKPEFGDVLLTKVGTTGIAKVIDVRTEFSIFVSLCLLKVPQQFISSEYIELMLNSPFVRGQSADGTQGVGNKNLVLKTIKAFAVPVPPLNAQKQIVSKVRQLLSVCDTFKVILQESKDFSDCLSQVLIAKVSNGCFSRAVKLGKDNLHQSIVASV